MALDKINVKFPLLSGMVFKLTKSKIKLIFCLINKIDITTDVSSKYLAKYIYTEISKHVCRT